MKNTLERETIATETKSAAAEIPQQTVVEEFRDEAISRLTQSWQVEVSEIDISARVAESITVSQLYPREEPLGQSESQLSPIGTSADEMVRRMYATEQRSREIRKQQTIQSDWERLVVKVYRQAQDNVARAWNTQNMISPVPAEFADYLDVSFALQSEEKTTLPTLTAENEQRLLEARLAGAIWAKEVLRNAHLFLVLRIAKSFLDNHIEPAQIFAAGLQGLQESIDSYDTSHHPSFQTYAMASIARAILIMVEGSRASTSLHASDSEEDSSAKQTMRGLGQRLMSFHSQEGKSIAQIREELHAERARVESARASRDIDPNATELIADRALREMKELLGDTAPEEQSADEIRQSSQDIMRRLHEAQGEHSDQSKADSLRLASESLVQHWQRERPVPDTPAPDSSMPQDYLAYLNIVRSFPLGSDVNVPPLTPEQEKQLAQARSAGGLWARDVMINANLRLVTAILDKRMVSGIPPRMLFRAGVRGLERAADSFDSEQGFRFATYATHWIRQEMDTALSEWETSAERQPPAPPHPPTAVGAPAPAPEPEELRELLQSTVAELRAVHEELNTLRAEVSELRRERAQSNNRPPTVPPRPSTARLFPFAPPEYTSRRDQ